MKKAQGLSVNIIIIAAIALVVMVIVVMIFAGKMSGFVDTSESCSSSNGQCVPSEDCDEQYQKIIDADCENEDHICCLTIGNN